MTRAPTSSAPEAPARPAGASVTTGQLAALLGARLVGRADLTIRGVGPLDDPARDHLTFIREQRHAARWARSPAVAALVSEGIDIPDHDPEARALLFVPSADMAIVALLERFGPPAPSYEAGVHPSAVVHPSARIDPSAHIGPLCTIDEGAEVGAHAVLVARVHLGQRARVGAHTLCHPGVVIGDRCAVGSHGLFHANVVLGGDGFGFLPHPETRLPVKIPHIGGVRVGDHVEMGPGCTIDRGKFSDTIVEDHVKLDNMVQIAHNCRIGAGSVICAQTGIAGSVTIGRGVTIGAQTGIADNLSVGDGASLAAKSGVMHHIPEGEVWGGVPAQLASQWLKGSAALRRLTPVAASLRKLAAERKDASSPAEAPSDTEDA